MIGFSNFFFLYIHERVGGCWERISRFQRSAVCGWRFAIQTKTEEKSSVFRILYLHRENNSRRRADARTLITPLLGRKRGTRLMFIERIEKRSVSMIT